MTDGRLRRGLRRTLTFAKERLGRPEEIVAMTVGTHSLDIAYPKPMAGV